MGLQAFIKQPEHIARLKSLRPPPPRSIGKPIAIPPRSDRHWLIGVAFDYLLRFELKRQAVHAMTREWAATSSLRWLFSLVQHDDGSWRSRIQESQLAAMAPIVAADSLDNGGDYVSLAERAGALVTGRTMDSLDDLSGRLPSVVYHASLDVAFKVGRRAQNIVQDAQAKYEAFIKMRETRREDQEQLARCAIRLAKLDVVGRSGSIDPTMLQEPEAGDVQELLDLLAVAPIESLINAERLILNPLFGDSSARIGGADCDLISGDTLIDIKTTAKSAIETQWLDQLLGYYLVARNQRTLDASFPEIRRLGLYFARHGQLWVRPVSQWVDHPQFVEIEQWFRVTALGRPRIV